MVKRPDRDLNLFGYAGASVYSEAWDIPLATPRFLKTTGIREDSDNAASAEFSYQWVPDNLGKRLIQADPDHPRAKTLSSKDVRHSSAKFKRYDDGWRLVQLDSMY